MPNFLASIFTAGVALIRFLECWTPTVKLSSKISLLSSNLPTTVPLSAGLALVDSKATKGSPVLITSPGFPYNLLIVPD